ncbi:hypothetical protein DFH06DRAFT_1299036 [Mycena polygramma]|nr:hypothetical protein DFH06DRAFT_1299036 [Mycena polygramma]
MCRCRCRDAGDVRRQQREDHVAIASLSATTLSLATLQHSLFECTHLAPCPSGEWVDDFERSRSSVASPRHHIDLPFARRVPFYFAGGRPVRRGIGELWPTAGATNYLCTCRSRYINEFPCIMGVRIEQVGGSSGSMAPAGVGSNGSASRAGADESDEWLKRLEQTSGSSDSSGTRAGKWCNNANWFKSEPDACCVRERRSSAKAHAPRPALRLSLSDMVLGDVGDIEVCPVPSSSASILRGLADDLTPCARQCRHHHHHPAAVAQHPNVDGFHSAGRVD